MSVIEEIYRKYFQKSLTFLYPLLDLKSSLPRPTQTYVSWKEHNIKAEDGILICVYERSNDESWLEFERDMLLTHPKLINSVEIDEEKIAYMFDLNPVREDYDAFLKGKFSQMSPIARKMIGDYYGIRTPEWVYIESFLYPSKYFKDYAIILNVEIEELEEVGELCEKYDPEKENCKHPLPKGVNIE